MKFWYFMALLGMVSGCAQLEHVRRDVEGLWAGTSATEGDQPDAVVNSKPEASPPPKSVAMLKSGSAKPVSPWARLEQTARERCGSLRIPASNLLICDLQSPLDRDRINDLINPMIQVKAMVGISARTLSGKNQLKQMLSGNGVTVAQEHVSSSLAAPFRIVIDGRGVIP